MKIVSRIPGPLKESSKEKTAPRAVFSLLLLLVGGVCLRNRVKFLHFVLLARVLLILVIVPSVVGMTFPNTIFVALGDHLYKHIL